MSIDLGPRTLPRQRTAPDAPLATFPRVVVLVAVLTGLLRAPFVTGPVSSDEGGFLVVARAWHSGGGSLYGRYWVDRPPLLLAVFKVADLLGGLGALRVIGCVASAVTVLALGVCAHRLLGRRGAVGASVVAGALLATPAAGAYAVNGELLALPFIAGSLALTAAALTTRESVRAALLAAGAGACAAAALLVKQNMGDGVVFAVVLAVLLHRAGLLREPVRLAVFFVGGAFDAALAVLATASLRGTDPGSVLFAMYPFRFEAAGVMGHLPLDDRLHRLGGLAQAWLLSGGPLLLVALVLLVVLERDRGHHVVALTTLAVAAYAVLSVAAGGSYWWHYLVELVPATALAGGILVAALPRAGRRAVAALAALSAFTWAGGLVSSADAGGQVIGTSLADVSFHGDSVVSVLGQADVVESSGLSSPYRYLWSLPARTLDPRFTQLAKVLSGSRAPTWVVVRGPSTAHLLATEAPGHALRSRYHFVGQLCGRDLYLRWDRIRRIPTSTGGDCRLPLAPWLHPPSGDSR